MQLLTDLGIPSGLHYEITSEFSLNCGHEPGQHATGEDCLQAWLIRHVASMLELRRGREAEQAATPNDDSDQAKVARREARLLAYALVASELADAGIVVEPGRG